jgi:hypothetical protein
MERLLLAWLCLCVAGCYNFTPANGAVKCGDNAAHPCPKGYACAPNHTCWKSGSVVPGTACTRASDCTGGFCADGVCCDSPCNGVCESCNQPGALGACTPIAAGSDPDHECAFKTAAAVPDAGTAGTITLDVNQCGGSCDGNRACKYPDKTTSCGAPFCSSEALAEVPTCDGNGSCNLQETSCQSFACKGGACNKSCSALTDCQTADYCNVNTNQCVAKKADGLPCVNDFECAHGHCVNPVAGRTAVCCNTACSDTGMSCDSGTCACQGQSCANGCQLFYRDSDGDKHGDETGTLGNGRAIAGCVGTAMIAQGGFNWYPDDQPNKQHLDCDDSDADTFYGQTTFFDHLNKRNNGDFNCDGVETHGLPEYNGMSCHICRRVDPSGACGQFGDNICTDTFYEAVGFTCGYVASDGGGGYRCVAYPTDEYGYNFYTVGQMSMVHQSGFTQIVACADTKPWVTCNPCPGMTNQAPPAQPQPLPTKTQTCR